MSTVYINLFDTKEEDFKYEEDYIEQKVEYIEDFLKKKFKKEYKFRYQKNIKRRELKNNSSNLSTLNNDIKLSKNEIMIKEDASKIKFNKEIDKAVYLLLRVSLSLPKNDQFFSKIGYITICSSVAAQNLRVGKRKLEDTTNFDDSGLKGALFGAADDANNMHNYLLEKSSEFINQGKFEFSSESINSICKEDFCLKLKNYFNSATNEASIIFYSGHGFPDGKIMIETSQGSYYLDYLEIIKYWRNRSYPHKNQHLLMIIDCCYSCKWVHNLLLNGDFQSVSIQASSNEKQKSNDLGKGKGSLFTGAFLQSNGNPIYCIDYNKQDILNKCENQAPISFGFKDICRNDYNFTHINKNSWKEFNKNIPAYRLFYLKNHIGNLTIIKKEGPTDVTFSYFEHVVFLFKEGLISCQCEIFFPEKEEKHVLDFMFKSEEISKITQGQVSIFKESTTKIDSKTAIYNGRYFNTYKNNKLVYNIKEETILDTISNFKTFLTNIVKTKKDFKIDVDLEISSIMKIYKCITQMNKAYIIQEDILANTNNDDEEEEEEFYSSINSDKEVSLESISLNYNNSLLVKENNELLRLVRFKEINSSINPDVPPEFFNLLKNKMI